MIIYLYGSDSYRRQKKLNKIAEEYRQKHSNLSLEDFDLEKEGEFERMKDFAGQMSLFEVQKMAVLKNISGVEPKELKEFLKANFKSDSLTILISEGSVSADLNKLLKDAFLTEEFKALEGDKFKFFIQKEVQNRGVSFSPDALNFLAQNFRGDTWGLVNELDKLSLWKSSGAGSVELADVKNAGDYAYQSPDIFNFINSVVRNLPVRQKISALEKILAGQDDAVKVFNIMGGLRYLPGGLIKKMADCDVMAKSGKLDYEDIFLSLALSG